MKKDNKGLYEQANVVWKSDSNGCYHRCFDDTFITVNDNNYTTQRDMQIGKSKVRVHSVFPIKTNSTATEKMLCVIDSSLENKLKKSC